jgi:ABC-type Co2+ transport system permease subunit
MHIEPGLVNEAKLVLSYATSAAALGYSVKLAAEASADRGVLSVLARGAIASAATLFFFQVLPHAPVGVSEVHLILGSTLFLILGAAPAALGLALGLLLQGMFFAPEDLPQYGMNITTLLVPLFALQLLAKRIIAPKTAYVDLTYAQTFQLSTAYQGGIVAWVAFWAIYGQGVGVANLTSVFTFGSAYMLVVLIEPLVDLGVLAVAKTLRNTRLVGPLTTQRLFRAA